MVEPYQDREEAGNLLAERLAEQYGGRSDIVVLALPRGGVPVAYPVARKLKAPMDVFLVRKLGVPGQEELAMGAIAEGGLRVLNDQVLGMLDISEEKMEEITEREKEELSRRAKLYRGDRERVLLDGKTVLLIDDGLATGSTMRVSVRALKQMPLKECIVAVPVAPPETCDAMKDEADDAICLKTPDLFMSVGGWYKKFEQTTDAEVRQLLVKAWGENQK